MAKVLDETEAWTGEERNQHAFRLADSGKVIPFGAEKWITLPSDLNMLTSSIAWIGCTFIFLSVVCSFLSSVPEVLWTFLTFLRGVPFPLSLC